MNALVSFWSDSNLGDDIMGETLIRTLQSQGINCFLTARDQFTYWNFSRNVRDVQIISEISKRSLKEKNIKLFIRIGGSIFQHKTVIEGLGRYKTLFQYLMMKRLGVKIALIGFNVGPFITKVGIDATKRIIKLSDLVTCRDKKTFEFVSKIRKSNSYIFPDIVFSRKDLRIPSKRDTDVLGISVYTGYTKDVKKYNYDYLQLLCNIANQYLIHKPNGRIKLFVFDSGYASDYPMAHRVYNNVLDKTKVEIVDFNGDINTFMEQFNHCSVMIGTRFHSIVLALLCNIPVLPVIYSNKTKDLLKDLDYKGNVIEFSNSGNVDIDKIVNCLCNTDGLLVSSNIDAISETANGHMQVLLDYITSLST